MSEIQALSSSVLNESKKMSALTTKLHFLTFTFSALSIFTPSTYSFILAMLMFIIEFFVFITNFISKKKKILGQHLLRLNILSNAFKFTPSIELSYLKNQVSDKENQESINFEDGEYYSTTDKNELNRLNDILSESCFWSQALYHKCAKSSGWHIICYIILIFILLTTNIALRPLEDDISLAKLFILLLTIVPLKDAIQNYYEYMHAATELANLDLTLSKINISIGPLLIVLTDYSVVTAYTPLISDKIYKKYKNQLNILWKERQESNKIKLEQT